MYGLHGMSSAVPEVQRLLRVLYVKLKNAPMTLKPQEACNYLYGFQRMNPKDSDVIPLIELLVERLEFCSRLSFSPQEISMALYGLQNMQSDLPVIEQLLLFLCDRIRDCKEPFSSQELCSSFYGLKEMSECDHHVSNILNALNCELEQINKKTGLEPCRISGILKGLRMMDVSYPEVRRALRLLKESIEMIPGDSFAGEDICSCLSCLPLGSMSDPDIRSLYESIGRKLGYVSDKEKLSAIDISIAFYGMRHMDCNDPSVRNIASALLSALVRSQENMATELSSEQSPFFSEMQLAMVCNSLQGRTLDWPEVRKLVAVIIQEFSKLIKNNAVFSDIHVGMIFYGLNSIYDDESHEFVSLIKVLTKVLDKNCSSLEAQAVSQLLYGLQSMTCSSDVMKKFMLVVANKLSNDSHSITDFNTQCIGNSLYGLQRMESSIDEVQDVLSVMSNIVRKSLRNSKKCLSGQEFSNALYGLKTMDNKDGEVSSLLSALLDSLEPKSIVSTMGHQEIGLSLFGLQNMSIMDDSLISLIGSLLKRADELNSRERKVSLSGEVHEEDGLQLLMLVQNMTLVHHTWSKRPDFSPVILSQLEATLNNLGKRFREIDVEKVVMPKKSRAASAIEYEVSQIFRLTLLGADTKEIVSCETNVMVGGIYEADLLLKIDATDGMIVVNIEVDGPWHKKSSLFDSLRDSYLSERGIYVVRLPATSSLKIIRSQRDNNSLDTLKALLLQVGDRTSDEGAVECSNSQARAASMILGCLEQLH